jgi:uncharacterized phage protein (TIGR02220 family)
LKYLILNKKIIEVLGLDAASIYAYLLEKKAALKVYYGEFFSVNLSLIEKELSIKRRKKELALSVLCNKSLIEIMRRELKFSKDVRICVNAMGSSCNLLQDNALVRCNILQDNASLRCNLLQDNALKEKQREVPSIYSYNIINYIILKNLVGINPNLSGVRKSILKFLKPLTSENKVVDIKSMPSNLVQKPSKLSSKPKTKANIKAKLSKKEIDAITAQEIILYLNKKTKKKFKANATGNLKYINARLKEKYSIDDFKKVIDLKVSQWTGAIFSNGESGEKFLRPSTLFSEKFDSYLNETEQTSLDDDLKNFFLKEGCEGS